MAKDKPMPPTTLDELKANLAALKLNAMLEALDGAIEDANTLKCGYVTFLASLVRTELIVRTESAAERRVNELKGVKAAGFPEIKTFDTFDWTFQPHLNVQLVKDLQNLQFVARGRCVLILGKPGTGKSHIGTAYGVLAALRGHSVAFYKATKLLTDLYATLADGSTDRFIAKLARVDLLVIDDLRAASPPRAEYANLMFDLIEARYRRKATIVSSNLAISDWGTKVLGNVALTGAIVDRLMDGAHVINIRRGKSYRSEGPDAPPLDQRPDVPPGDQDDE